MAWPEWMKLVEVEWIDSSEFGGWNKPKEWDELIQQEELLCRSVGYLFRDNEHVVILAQSQSAHGSVSDMLAIPKVAVKMITVLITSVRMGEG